MSFLPTQESPGVGPAQILGQGEWIGEYEVIRRIRHGGMATLFMGRKHGAAGFARNAAIKVIHPHLSVDEKFVRMFVDEARICSQISHPNVIHVEAFGEERGLHYLVMEYLEGCSLSEILRRYRKSGEYLDPELAAHIVLQAAGGLHAAHEARGMDGKPLGIVHRDVTPSNILLSTDGHVKIIDFGIAKSRGRLAETQAGQALKGKLKYMAPEQAEPGDIDRRADIFSLGVVFWELLVGAPLFPDEGEMALLKRLTDPDIALPSVARPGVPEALDELVLSMLSQNPDLRPETAWDVRRRIVAALPLAATRQSEELGNLTVDVISRRPAGAQEITDVSVDPLGTGASPFAIGAGSLPRPMSDYQEIVVMPKPALFSRPLVQVALFAAVVGLSVMVGLNLSRWVGNGSQASPAAAPVPAAQTSAPIAPAPDQVAPGAATVAPAGVATKDEGPAADTSGDSNADEEASDVRKRKSKSKRRKKRTERKKRRDAIGDDGDAKSDSIIKRGGTTIVDDFDDGSLEGKSESKTIRRGDTEIQTDFGD